MEGVIGKDEAEKTSVGAVIEVVGYLARGMRWRNDSQMEWVEENGRDENVGSKYRQ